MSREAEMQAALWELRRAIHDKGRVPPYHDKIMERHRKEWPTLWQAIDKLLSIKAVSP